MTAVLLCLALLITIAALSIFLTGKDINPFDFDSPKLPSRPNFALTCPKNICQTVKHEHSPTFPATQESLKHRWIEAAKKIPNTTLISQNNNTLFYRQVVHILSIPFPDFITIKFIPIDSNHSSVAIFSESKYGYSDLGKNTKRINNWLTILHKLSKETS